MKYALTLPVVLVATACTNSGANYQPILDGQPSAAFQSDLTSCQSLARKQDEFGHETAGAIVLGAGVGALLGEVDVNDPLGGALWGALAGGGAAAANGTERREAIVVQCLRGRGHPVVG